MTFAVLSNIMTMLFCIAVLFQSVRLMRAFDAVKGGALTQVVAALDASTNEAQRVLDRLTDLLRGDVAVTARTISEGKAMIEELTVMTWIANAIAERIVDAAGASNRSAPPARHPRTAPPAAQIEAQPSAGLPGPALAKDAADTPTAAAPRRQRSQKPAPAKAVV